MRIEPGMSAVVTGATRGIGRATALALAARGVRLGLVARDANDLEALAAEIGGGALALAADIGERDEIAAAMTRFAEEAGGVDLVVANAGIAHYGPFADQPLEHAEQMVKTNVLGTIYTVGAALEQMLDRARGHIVVLSSAAGLRAFPWAAVYGATKAAGRGFAEALRHELSGTGIGVTTILPGEVETSLHDHEPDKLPDWRDENLLSPEAVAAVILRAVEEDRREAYIPGLVRLLGLNGLAPRLSDRLVALVRGPSAAPRRD